MEKNKIRIIGSKRRGFWQGQYFCFSKEKFPKDVREIFLGRNKQELVLDNLEKIRFVDIKEQKFGDRKYLYGQIVVKAKFNDFDFEVDGKFNLIKKENQISRSFIVPFILELEGNFIMFFKKDYAETFGKKVLSHIIFGDNDTIKNLEFDIEKIRKAKRRGEFSNLWMNTVISGGQIQMQSQYGDNIDRDSRFLDDPAYSRKGVGIEIKTHLNDRIKIAIWKSGSIVICKSYDTFQDNVLLYFLLVEKFLRYSNFSII